MKIKRKEHERLIGRSAQLADLERIVFILRTRIENEGTTTLVELVRMPLVSYALMKARDEYGGLREPEYMTGTFDIEFLRITPGYDAFLVSKYTGQPNPFDIIRQTSRYGKDTPDA